MNEKLLEEHLLIVKESASSFRTLYIGLLGFALAIGVTLLVQSIESENIEKQRISLEKELLAPWNELEIIYERTHGLLDGYAKKYSTPWSQLCFLLYYEYQNINENLGDEKDNPKISSTIETVSQLGNTLIEYNSHVLNIVYAHNVALAFDSLPKDTLSSINYLLNFDETNDFLDAIEQASKLSALMRHLYQKKEPKDRPPKVMELLDTGVNNSFETLTTELLLTDLRSLGGKNSSDERKRVLDQKIDRLSGDNLGGVKRRIRNLNQRLGELESSSTVKVPIIQVHVPNNLFWIVGALVNSFILYLLMSLYLRAANSFKVHAQSSDHPNSNLYEILSNKFSIKPNQNWPIRVWDFLVLISPTALSAWSYLFRHRELGWQIVVLGVIAALNLYLAYRVIRQSNAVLPDRLAAEEGF